MTIIGDETDIFVLREYVAHEPNQGDQWMG